MRIVICSKHDLEGRHRWELCDPIELCDFILQCPSDQVPFTMVKLLEWGPFLCPAYWIHSLL